MEVHDSPNRLPDWLVHVPMDAPKPTWIPVSPEKSVPLRTLVEALQAKVGQGIGSLAVAPELGKRIAQLTENPSWKNLPSEATMVRRLDEETWEVHVGDFRGNFTKEELLKRIREAIEKEKKK